VIGRRAQPPPRVRGFRQELADPGPEMTVVVVDEARVVLCRRAGSWLGQAREPYSEVDREPPVQVGPQARDLRRSRGVEGAIWKLITWMRPSGWMTRLKVFLRLR
jgi:hypothetical protein